MTFMLLCKRAMIKDQVVLFLRSNRLGMALVEENCPSPWPWKKLGVCWWLKSSWPTLPMLLPNPFIPALGTAEPSLLKDHKQPYQMKYYSFPYLSFSQQLNDIPVPVWTCLNLCQRQGNLPFHFLFCLKTSLLSLFTSLLHTVRGMTAFSQVWLGLSGVPRRETPPDNTTGQPQHRYECGRGVIWPTHPPLFPLDTSTLSFQMQHLSDNTNKAVDTNQRITEQMKAEKIQGWNGKVGKKNTEQRSQQKSASKIPYLYLGLCKYSTFISWKWLRTPSELNLRMMRENLADSLPMLFMALLSTIFLLPHRSFFNTGEMILGKVLKCHHKGKSRNLDFKSFSYLNW